MTGRERVPVAAIGPGDPVALAVARMLFLPERGARLKVIHQERGGSQRRLAMGGGGYHEHDVLARPDAPEAMNDREPLQRPARHRVLGMPPDFRFRHARVMFQRQRRDRVIALAAAADAGKAHHRADIGTAVR